MAKTVIVGRVSVKVWPDTGSFKQKLKAELEQATKDAKAEVDVTFDPAQMARELRDKVKDLNALVKGRKGFMVRIGTEVGNTAETFRDLKRAVKEVQLAADSDRVEIRTRVRSARGAAIRVRPEVDRSGWDEFRRALARFDNKIRLAPAVDRSALERAKEMMQRALASHGKVDLGVEFNRERALSAKRRLQLLIGKTTTMIQAKADLIRAARERAKLKRLLGDFELDIKPSLRSVRTHLIKTQLQTLFGEIGVRVGVLISPESIAVAKAALAASFRTATVRVRAVLDSKSYAAVSGAFMRLTGGRLMKKVFAIDALKDLDLALPKIALLSTGIGNLVAATIAATGATLALGRSLTEIIPGALALPGIFAGLVVAATSFGMAMADATKVIPELKTQLKGIKDANSEGFWSVAENDFRSFLNDWIPKFQLGMSRVGKATGGVFASLLTSLQAVASSRLEGWFKAVTVALGNFVSVGGTGGLANIVRGFGDLGAIYLPRFMTWLGKITGQFGAFLTQAVASGDAMNWIDNSVVRLRQLWDSVVGLTGIFGGLSRAAMDAGFTGLKGFSEGLLAASAVINSPTVQQGLIGVFDASRRAMENLFTIAGPGISAMFASWSQSLTVLLPTIGAVGGALLNAFGQFLANPAVAAGLLNVFKGIGSAISTLMPVVDQLAIGFGGLATLVGTALQSFAPIVAVAFGAAGNAANGLLAALNQIIPVMAGGLLAVLNAVRPAIEQLTPVMSGLAVTIGTALGGAMKALAPAIGAMMSGLVPLFTALANVIGPLIAQLIAGLVPILSVVFTGLGQIGTALAPLVTVIGGVLSQVLGIVLSALQKAAAVLMPMLVDAMTNLSVALTPVFAELGKFLTVAGPAISDFLAFLITTIGMAIPGIINGIAGVINGVVNVINGIITFVTGVFSGDWGKAWEGIQQILSGAWEAIKGIIEIALNVGVLGIVRKGFALLKGLFSDGMAAIRLGWEGFWKGLQDIATAVWDAVKSGVSGFFTAIKGFFSTGTRLIKASWDDLWLGIKIATEAAWKGLSGAIKTGIDNAVSMFKALPSKIVGALGDLSNLLVDSGKSILDGLARGIRQGVDGAVGAATNAMDAIRRLFPHSPAKEGPFSGKGWVLYSGMSISEALADGIVKRASAPRDAALAMAAETKSALSDASLASSSVISRAHGAGITVGSSSGDTFDIQLTVNADEIGDVADLIDRMKKERQKRRQMGGR